MNATACMQAKTEGKGIIFNLILIGFIAGASLLFSTTEVKAKTCEEDYLTYENGGIVPTTDPLLVSNCNSAALTTQSGTGTKIAEDRTCYDHRDHSVTYCINHTYFKAIAGGEVIIYGKTDFLTVSDSYGNVFRTENIDGNEIRTGIVIAAQDALKVEIGEHEELDGTGWRTFDEAFDYTGLKPFFDTARADALSKGYIILAEQTWADALTGSLYDSYDFEDLGVLVAVRPTAPGCGDEINLVQPTNLSMPGYPIYLGDTVHFQVYHVSGDETLYKYVGNTFDPAVNLGSCSPKLNDPKDCQVLSKPAYPATAVTWTHQYQNCIGTNCSPICEATIDFNIFPYPGFLRTDLGDTFLRGPDDATAKAMDQPKFPASGVYISKYTFGSQKPQYLHFPNTPPEILSFKKYLLLTYDDRNNTYDDGNSIAFDYDWLSRKLLNDPRLSASKKGYESSITLHQLNFDDFKDTKLVHLKNNASLTIDANIECKYPTIFLVEGDLVLKPDFLIDGNSACLFIVKGDTLIPWASSADTIQSFIISGTYHTEPGSGSLTVKGGVINNNTDFTRSYYQRNINLTITQYNSVDRVTPSEVLNYEGARYLYHFGLYLQNPFTLNLRELQYTSNL